LLPSVEALSAGCSAEVMLQLQQALGKSRSSRDQLRRLVL
jgi:hypothetical protein